MRVESHRGADAAKRPTTSATRTVPSQAMTVRKWFATSAVSSSFHRRNVVERMAREEQRHGDDRQACDDVTGVDDALGEIVERLADREALKQRPRAGCGR